MKGEIGCRNHKYVILPCLKDKMAQAGATHITLSEASGVSIGCIHRAKTGKPIHLNLGIALYNALATRLFNFKRRGPHAKATTTKKETAK
jgi:hypothetical protein